MRVLFLCRANSHDLKLAFSDWLVSPDEIEICTRHDGSYWHLGSGGFGCVSTLFILCDILGLGFAPLHLLSAPHSIPALACCACYLKLRSSCSMLTHAG